MIITLIAVGVLIVSLILFIISDRITDFYLSDNLNIFGGMVAGGSSVALICFLIVICGAHTGVDIKIEENRIQYESLLQRQEMINSDYEDISKSEVIKDIAKWNTGVQRNRYWAYNPWTNWFYSKRVVDELKLVE